MPRKRIRVGMPAQIQVTIIREWPLTTVPTRRNYRSRLGLLARLDSPRPPHQLPAPELAIRDGKSLPCVLHVLYYITSVYISYILGSLICVPFSYIFYIYIYIYIYILYIISLHLFVYEPPTEYLSHICTCYIVPLLHSSNCRDTLWQLRRAVSLGRTYVIHDESALLRIIEQAKTRAQRRWRPCHCFVSSNYGS